MSQTVKETPPLMAHFRDELRIQEIERRLAALTRTVAALTRKQKERQCTK